MEVWLIICPDREIKIIYDIFLIKHGVNYCTRDQISFDGTSVGLFQELFSLWFARKQLKNEIMIILVQQYFNNTVSFMPNLKFLSFFWIKFCGFKDNT